MKENLTEIIFIIDKSGSMGNLVSDTIGGYNSFIDEQRKQEGEALVTTVLFSNNTQILHGSVDIKKIEPLTTKDYKVGGSTALLDAIGETVNSVGHRLSITPEENKPSKVIFVITTDGEENSSREFTRNQIKEMITHQTEKYNWQFMFLGANINAVTEAESIGIKGMYASNYSANSIGTQSLYCSLSRSISDYRNIGEIKSNWNEDIK